MTSFYINPVYESEQTHRGFFLKHTEISGSFSSDITKQNYRDVSGMQIWKQYVNKDNKYCVHWTPTKGPINSQSSSVAVLEHHKCALVALLT